MYTVGVLWGFREERELRENGRTPSRDRRMKLPRSTERVDRYMIKLICSDIDGTLLPEGTAEINPEIFAVIRKLKEKDIIFAAASGDPIPA